MRKLITSLLFLATGLPATAQEMLGDIAPEEAEVRRYTVEVIVFRYAQDVMTGSEVFPGERPAAESAAIADDTRIVDERPGPLPDTEVALLDRSDFQLLDVMRMMRRLDVYDPVMHFGWTQTTWPAEQTEAIPLQRLARVAPGFDGELTLYLGRYLHLVVDLRLEATGAAAASRDDAELLGDIAATGERIDRRGRRDARVPVYYRIREDRILKNGELRYYDHPKFGMLARVTRVEQD